ncbi:hypothetical protein HCH_05907 [Hahella chejuensis KCTC 2396]|uniref:Uncharacterized protein n=1 Tax=Hahella chejuensis (strain KCTC 2396) TaxID=349521 RepID=Q2S9W7_HAHCH|nr:hypothetical protein [Hahella chejuensis]ABC32557.1 hypothetical protein HCH_05907 [Hahella chejuensis KCTC 2396]
MNLLYENDRQTYLTEMGVAVWYARRPLSNAAPSTLFEFDETSEASGGPAVERGEGKPSPPREPSLKSAQQAAALRQTMSAIAQPEQVKQKKFLEQEKRLKPVPVNPSPATIDKLRAMSIKGGDIGMLALSKGEMEISPESSSGQLLANIALAIGLGEQWKDTYGLFSWPPFERKGLPMQDDAMLAKLLARWSDPNGLKHCILFCEAEIVATLGGLDPMWRGDRLLQLPSLDEMLQNPSIKKLVWRRLRQYLYSND